MSELQKLIEGGGWRPISEAPMNGRSLLLKFSGNELKIGAWRYKEKYLWGDYDCEEGWQWRSDTLIVLERPTHFMLLDTPELMAKIIGVLVEDPR